MWFTETGETHSHCNQSDTRPSVRTTTYKEPRSCPAHTHTPHALCLYAASFFVAVIVVGFFFVVVVVFLRTC